MTASVQPSVLPHASANKFGIFGWHPKSLQWLCYFRPFMAFVCANAFLQGAIVNGLVSTSISSIEKRFNLTSTQSGTFAATYDVFVTIMLLPLALYTAKVNKVRAIGWGMIFVGIGGVLIVVPQFMDGHYEVGDLKPTVCSSSTVDTPKCETSTPLISGPYFFLLLSQAFIGIGASPLFTYGYTCIDEFDSHKKTGRNMGIYMSFSTVGPALAFIAGGASLKIWGDIGRTTPESVGIIGRSDPRWYGAWWLGFLVCGLLAFVTAIPLTMFPEKLNDTDARKKSDVTQTHLKLNKDFSNEKYAFMKILLMFLTSPTVMAIIGMQTLESMVMNGYITFVPKLLETLFGFSSGNASVVTGAIVVPMGVIGSVLGGIISKRLKNDFRKSMFSVMILTLVTAAASACLLIRCNEAAVAGITADLSTLNNRSRSVVDSCNSDCSCENIFEPVCSVEMNVNFLSPCHAGCRTNVIGAAEWEGCTCSGYQEKVSNGWCSVDCQPQMIIFFSLFALMAVTIFACAPLMQSASFRVVHFNHRDQFVCFGWLFMRVLGSIPGAILFGHIIDRNCLFWQKDCDGEKCQLYNAKDLGFSFSALTIAIKLLCVAMLSIAYFSYRKIENDATEKEQSLEEKNKFELDKKLTGGISVANTMVY
ncbi:unnamed protein product [Caenorhabditis auriculariae]|uniref:Solute carrier organic anion transporter family member n=1 Tax=Caenorhabditis auriculariae TaxID=2777116 RepID=A0A8S1HGJ0_9PELO|nr:unnamed protein product [Caenorhabditis auriculariae]